MSKTIIKRTDWKILKIYHHRWMWKNTLNKKYIESLKNPVSVCAWCYNKTEKEKEAIEKWFSVTHGICEECAKKYFD